MGFPINQNNIIFGIKNSKSKLSDGRESSQAIGVSSFKKADVGKFIASRSGRSAASSFRLNPILSKKDDWRFSSSGKAFGSKRTNSLNSRPAFSDTLKNKFYRCEPL